MDISPENATNASGRIVESTKEKVNVAFSPYAVLPGLSTETYVLRAIIVALVYVESSLW